MTPATRRLLSKGRWVIRKTEEAALADAAKVAARTGEGVGGLWFAFDYYKDRGEAWAVALIPAKAAS